MKKSIITFLIFGVFLNYCNKIEKKEVKTKIKIKQSLGDTLFLGFRDGMNEKQTNIQIRKYEKLNIIRKKAKEDMSPDLCYLLPVGANVLEMTFDIYYNFDVEDKLIESIELSFPDIIFTRGEIVKKQVSNTYKKSKAILELYKNKV